MQSHSKSPNATPETKGTLEVATGLRREISGLEGKIGKLITKKMDLVASLTKIEDHCVHQWGQAELIKGSKVNYQRTCGWCGKTQKSKGVKVEF